MKWEEPGQRGHRGGAKASYLEEASELRAHPGEWGVLKEFPAKQKKRAYLLQGAIRYGRLRAFLPAGSFEASARSNGTVAKVHARYVGEQENE